MKLIAMVPDHFLQTFMWSKRAVELGDLSQKQLMGLGIDRYLVNTNRKQLFASQATKDQGSDCWCLYQVEKSFSDSKRVEYTGRDLQAAFAWVDELNKGIGCGPAAECSGELKATPSGSVPGFW